MCRIVAYVGPPLRLSAVLDGPPHGLVRQSYAPRLMTEGRLNADGWGVGWLGPGGSAELLKGTLPIWSDENVAGAGSTVAGSFVAAVRAASPGLPVSWSNTPPYRIDGRLVAHNGRIWPWAGGAEPALRERTPLGLAPEIRGTTDSERLAALWAGLCRDRDDGDTALALGEALGLAAEAAERAGGGITATLAIVGPTGLLAARFARGAPAPSLFLLEGASRFGGGTLLASEPLDEGDGWREVPPDSIATTDEAGRLVVGPLCCPEPAAVAARSR